MRELAEHIFNVPVRIGKPLIQFDLPDSLQHPLYATGYGLLLYQLKKREHQEEGERLGITNKIIDRMKSWISDLF